MNFAGNSKKLSTNFCEVLEGVWAYKMSHTQQTI